MDTSLNNRISVVMPVYNGAQFLAAAVNSILAQSYGDFEFVIVDDASTDETPALLARLTDPRIKILTHSTNSGIVASLNDGLAAATGEYIARMDADDISLPARFAKQIDFLTQRPNIGLVGCAAEVITPAGDYVETMHPKSATDGGLRWFNLFGSPFIHPTVMMRRALVMQVGGYDPTFTVAQDRDLWDRLLTVTQVAYLPDILFQRRVHRSSVSITHNPRQAHNATRVAQRAMRAVLGVPVDFDLAARLQFEDYTSPDQVAGAAALISQLYNAFTAKHTLLPAEARFVRGDYVRRLYRMAQRWPRDVRMRRVMLRAVATDPGILFTWLAKQVRARMKIATHAQRNRDATR